MADKDFIVKNGLVVGGDLTTTLVKFNDNDASNWVAFASPATVSSNITWTLPSADAGVSGYALVSNGSGTLSWAAAGATTSSDESTNTDFLIHFDNITSGAVTAVKHDTGLTYNPSTGTLAAATFSGALTGNADTATQLATTRAIQVSGAVTGTANFDGSAAINIVTTNTADPTITLAGDLSGAVTLTNLASGTLTATVGTLNQNTTGSAATLTTARAIQVSGAVTGTANFDGSAAINIVTTATNDPTITLAGDLSGAVTLTNLASGTLTATVGTLNQNTTGSAATLTTARAIQVSGAVTGTANFDGSAAINIVTTHTADPVITLTGAVTGSGTMTNLGSVSITTTNTADPVLTLAGDATGSATFTNLGNATLTVAVVDDSHNHSSSSGNFTVGGNLVVNGTTVTVNAATITIDDPIITLGGDTTPGADDNKDRGIEFKWHNGTAAKVGFFGFDDSTGYLTFIPDATNTSEVFSGTVGDIQATNFRGALIGNASTATTLQTARTIGGVSFNGSANINLPGVNAAGNQNTTGSAATLTTARTINGVSFNGSANITVADATKLPLTGGAITGAITSTSTFDGRDVSVDGAKLDGIAAGANNYSFPYTVSAAAGNSTVVQRDASGYIFGGFFNGTGTFSTTGETSGMGRFTGTNGTDNYGRSYTAAAARTLLNVADGANNYSFPYTVSATEGINTVVQRNSSGYLHASYFNGTGSFATSGAASGMATFTGGNGSDTYARPFSAAAARTLLNVADGANNITNTNQLTNGAGYITGYTETDTFSTVATRGNSYINGGQGGISVGETFTNYAGWNTQLNVHGGPHSRLTVKTDTVQMGVYAHNTWQSVSGVTPGGFVGTYNDYPLSFLVNTSQKMVINTSGNVGIGTSSPAEKLHVVGNIIATGDVNLTAGDRLLVGGNWSDNSYNTNTESIIALGGGNDIANYSIKTTMENTGGNYTKLDLRWHTGVRVFSIPSYGGVRFFSDAAMTTQTFSVNNGDGHVRVANNLYVGSTTSSNIVMIDTDEGNRTIHCNSNNIGFLNAAGGWSAYSTDAGLWACASGLSVTGTATATTFSGSGASLTALNGSNISTGTVAAARVATLNQNTTGSAATLTTARTINGVSFNGSANITIADSTKVPTGGFTSATNAYFYFTANQNHNGSSPPLQVYSNNGGGAIMSFHRGGYYAVNMGLDSDNVFRIGGWSAGTNRLQMDMSGNLTMAGSVTATTFTGSGSGLTNVNDSTKLPLAGGTMSGAFGLQQQKINFHSGAGGTTFAANHYSMGIDIANGSWSHPNYSDLIIGYHTGIRIGAHYSGTRFYANSPTTDANNDGQGDAGETLLMTVGGAGLSHLNVSVANALSVGGSITVGNTTSSDIYMVDTDEGTRRIHCNSNRIGFLTQAEGWGSYCNDDGSWTSVGTITAYSDVRLKSNIQTIESGLDKVCAMRGVTFEKDGVAGLGVIAQEMEAIIPEVVITQNDGMKSVAYGNIVGVLIEAIKEQDSTINSLRNDVETLKDLVNKLMGTK